VKLHKSSLTRNDPISKRDTAPASSKLGRCRSRADSSLPKPLVFFIWRYHRSRCGVAREADAVTAPFEGSSLGSPARTPLIGTQLGDGEASSRYSPVPHVGISRWFREQSPRACGAVRDPLRRRVSRLARDDREPPTWREVLGAGQGHGPSPNANEPNARVTSSLH